MRMVVVSQAVEYPYYIAERREGRLKGMAPPNIRAIPSLRRKWDGGGFGTGVRTTEERAPNPRDLLDRLRSRNVNPQFDDVEFYVVRAPNSPRERIQYGRLLAEIHQHDPR